MKSFLSESLRQVRRTSYVITGAVLAVLPGLLFAGTVWAESQVRTYDWMTAGQVSGELTLSAEEDGSRLVDFQFNDRGRGPKLHELLRMNDAGLLTQLEISGHAYMGATVDERFEATDGSARWTSTLENGTAPAGAFYWANDGTPEDLAILARALLGRADGSLPLYPAGSAAIRRVAQYGETDEIEYLARLYAIDGLDLEPAYLWLDANNELFALTQGWMGLILRGQAAIMPDL